MIKRLPSKLIYSLLVVAIVFMASCSQNYTPLPRGYFRIELPERNYIMSDTTFPYYFEYPEYAKLQGSPHNPNQKYWINIEYPQFKATVHLSYKSIDDNLITYLEDAYTLVSKHIPKAEEINDSLIVDNDRNIYGLTYKIEGNGAASPYQFFVTDSASHFLRGALYFNIIPNNDSLEPVIDFITSDIEHLINTLKWNDDAN
ncbi:MAG: gliding motility lipoprotein GldD [Bacteroidetes bacterium]|nr:gliding motility lipoprotein GldD [Bacteroidota bacterium]MBL6943157.1 gliding motility lipoprotein GldD [Bacteroidales bacterium]